MLQNEAGMRDSYREVHPQVLQYPGSFNLKEGEFAEKTDFYPTVITYFHSLKTALVRFW